MKRGRQAADGVSRNMLSSMTTMTMPVTSNPEANELLVNDPLALLIGMLLDHKVR
jgi:hypothetical protein